MAHRRTPSRRLSGSRTTRKKQGQGILSRAGRLLLIGIACFVLGKMGLLFGEKLLMLISEARRYRQDIATLRHETEWYAQQNAALKREEQRLTSRSGIILEGRRKGYGFPGERLLVIEKPATQPAPKP